MAKADQNVMDVQSTAIEILLRATAVKQGNVAHAIAVSNADVDMRNAVRRCRQRLAGGDHTDTSS